VQNKLSNGGHALIFQLHACLFEVVLALCDSSTLRCKFPVVLVAFVFVVRLPLFVYINDL